MNHTFKNENGHLVATATFNKEEIGVASNKAVNQLCKEVTVRGYRKGKAPFEEARKHISSEQLANSTIQELLKVVDKEFFKDPEFNGYSLLNGFRPKVSLDKFSNEEAVFTISYVLRPYVAKIGKYSGLKADVKEAEVTDKDVEDRIKQLAEQNSELVTKEKEAEMGDVVNIDFVGLLDGEAFDGGSAKSFDLELGSKRFVPGFEEQLVHAKAGDKVDVHVTLPAEYPESLANKNVLFKVTINAVKSKEVPEINDEFATTLSGRYVAKDLNELKQKVKDILVEQHHQAYENQVLNSLLNQVKAESEFVVPEEYLDSITDRQIKYNSDRLEQQGVTLEDYLKLVKQDMKDYRDSIRSQLASQLDTSLLYDAIFAAEKLAYPTNEELEKKLGKPINQVLNELNSYFKSLNQSDKEIRAQTNNYLNEVNSSIIYEKVQNRLLELNGYKVVEKPKDEKKEEVKAAESNSGEAEPADDNK